MPSARVACTSPGQTTTSSSRCRSSIATRIDCVSCGRSEYLNSYPTRRPSCRMSRSSSAPPCVAQKKACWGRVVRRICSSLGFCSLHSHCDSVFQQSDQLSGTVSAGCHRSNMLPYAGLPQCDKHVEEGSVRKELRSKPFVGAHFPMWVQVFPCGCKFSTCTCPRQDGILSPQGRWVGFFELWVHIFPCGCKFSHVAARFQLAGSTR